MACLTISPTNPCDGGTAVISMEYLDESGDPANVSDLQWQLSDKHGVPIEGMEFEDNDFSGDSVTLTGDQLKLSDSSDFGVRYFAVKGTYSSSAGSGLTIVGELKFTIQDLKNIDPLT